MGQVKIGDKTLSKEQKAELYFCISARLGYIETGEISLRAIDAQKSGQSKKIKALTIEQKELTIFLERLMIELIN